MNAIFGATSPFSGAPVGRTGTFYMNPDGTIYKSAADGTHRYTGGLLEPGTGLPWRKLDPITGQLRENQPRTLAQIPLERSSLFGRAHIDLADNIRAFAQMMYSENSTRATGSDPPMLGGWRTPIPHGNGIYGPSVTNLGADGLPNTADAGENMATRVNFMAGGVHGLNCAPVGGCTKSQVWPTPPQLTALLDSRPNREADFDVVQSVVWAGSRRSFVDTLSYQLIGGLEGDFGIKDWTWEAYISSGSTRTINTYLGATSLARWRFVQGQPNYGKGLFYTGNEYGAGFGAGTITCTSGINSVNGVNGWTEGTVPSEDCQEAVTMQPQAVGHMKQTVMEYNMQGSIAELRRGDLRFAAGVSGRVNKYQFYPDPTNTPQSVLDQPGSFFPVGEALGKTEAQEIYGELLVPLLSDKPGVESLTLEVGYRRTDNDPSEDVDTYKALIDWAIVDRVRFAAAGRSRTARRTSASCSRLPSSSPHSRSCKATRVRRAIPRSCRTRRTRPSTGRAPRACRRCARRSWGRKERLRFYGDPSSQPNTLQVARISNLIGNPNLNSEKAETVTAGFVIDIAERSSLTIDYWRIRITDMIADEFGDILYENCMDEDTNPTYDPNHPACLRLVRNPNTGANATLSTSFNNEQQVDLAGYDVQYNWDRALGPGSLNVSALATITDHTKTRPSPTADWFDYKGSSGPSNIRSVNSYSYDYRLLTSVGYTMGDWNASIRWRYLPSIKSESSVRTLVSLDEPTSAYSIFDGSARYNLTSKSELRFGVDNLFNVDPEITFRETGRYTNTGDTNENFYDFLGRRWYVGYKMSF